MLWAKEERGWFNFGVEVTSPLAVALSFVWRLVRFPVIVSQM